MHVFRIVFFYVRKDTWLRWAEKERDGRGGKRRSFKGRKSDVKEGKEYERRRSLERRWKWEGEEEGDKVWELEKRRGSDRKRLYINIGRKKRWMGKKEVMKTERVREMHRLGRICTSYVRGYVHIDTTVKSSNFVILLGENIFFRWTFLRRPHDFFWYWNLCGRGLGIAQIHFGLGHCLGLENLFFSRVTKLGDRHLISSPSEVFKVTMTTFNRGC